MQSHTNLHPQSDRFDARAFRPAEKEIRRAGWEALSDLGLTDVEIAAYYGIGAGRSKEAWTSGSENADRISVQ
ncbi:MAG: hypothetical protein WAU86_18380 [Oricola sp.]